MVSALDNKISPSKKGVEQSKTLLDKDKDAEEKPGILDLKLIINKLVIPRKILLPVIIIIILLLMGSASSSIVIVNSNKKSKLRHCGLEEDPLQNVTVFRIPTPDNFRAQMQLPVLIKAKLSKAKTTLAIETTTELVTTSDAVTETTTEERQTTSTIELTTQPETTVTTEEVTTAHPLKECNLPLNHIFGEKLKELNMIPGEYTNFFHHMVFPLDAIVYQLNFYAAKGGSFYFSVWRLTENSDRYVYTLQSKHLISSVKGLNIKPGFNIRVNEGDIVGLHYTKPKGRGLSSAGRSYSQGVIDYESGTVGRGMAIGVADDGWEPGKTLSKKKSKSHVRTAAIHVFFRCLDGK